MLKKAALVIVALLILLFLAVSCQESEMHVERSEVINKPAAEIFPWLNNFRNWQAWSPWADLDPNASWTYDGPDEGQGARFHWSGNDEVGVGSMAIAKSTPFTRIDYELNFTSPFEDESRTSFILKARRKDVTEVVWTMDGRNNFVEKFFNLIFNFEREIGLQYEKGLDNLKKRAEATPRFTTEVARTDLGEVNVVGAAPSEQAKTWLSNQVQSLVKSTNEIQSSTMDLTIQRQGAPGDWQEGFASALPLLAHSTNAKVGFNSAWHAQVNVSEEYQQLALQKPLSAARKIFGKNIQVEKIAPELSEAEQACQNALNAKLQTHKITFESASASISPSSYDLLSELALLFEKCPGSKVEIGGHTDSDGDDTLNEHLSQARAGSVKNFLAAKGVEARRLVVKGYGESRPIAPNSDDAGKAKNRRIEFRVRH